MRVAAGLFGVAIRAIISAVIVCEFISDVYQFLWMPGAADLVVVLASSAGRLCILWVA